MKSRIMLLLTVTIIIFGVTIQAQEVPELLHRKYLELDTFRANGSSKTKLAPDISPEELLSLSTDLVLALKSSNGANLDLIADQLTSTNNFRGFWSYAYEPRRELINAPASSDYLTINALFQDFTSVQISTASYIHFFEDSSATFEFEGNDLTDAVLAGLYLIKGVAGAHIGLIYDQGFLVPANKVYSSGTSIEHLGLSLAGSDSLLKSSIKDMETAITIVESLSDQDFAWFFNEMDTSVTREAFLKIANSLIAKVLINSAKNSSDEVDYAKVLAHANAGLDADFPNILLKTPGNTILLEDYYSDFSTFLIGCSTPELDDCSGYLPVDVKVMHLLNDTYPTEYPEANVNGLVANFPENTSSDPRLAYFKYSTNAGFLNASRDPLLFSNYFSVRGYAGNDWSNENYPIILMTRAELQYIKAEAEFMLGNLTNANAALQESPYGVVASDFSIDLPSVQLGYMDQNGLTFNGPMLTSDEPAFIKALHKEYAVEIGTFTTIGTHWFFMRRHGLLQELSPTVLPLPSDILKSYQLPGYSSGGVGNYENGRSAQRDNPWHLSAKYPEPSGFRAEVSSQRVDLFWDLFPASYPDQPTQFVINGSINDTVFNLSPAINSLTIDSLANNFTYTFELAAKSSEKTSEEISLLATPNIFSTEISMRFDNPVYTNEEVQKSIWLRNKSSTSTTIQSVQKMAHPVFEVDSSIYDNWLDFINIDISNAIIEPGDSLLATVSFNSEFFGSYPFILFEFTTDKGPFKFIIQRTNVSVRANEGQSLWSVYYNTPDSIAFGEMLPNTKDTARFYIYNNSLYGKTIIQASTIGVDESGDTFQDSVFTFESIEDTVWLSSGEKHLLTLYAEPKTSQPYTARVNVSGTISVLQLPTLTILSVNNGERYVVANEQNEENPKQVHLYNNYPNPFNPTTNIQFSLPTTSNVQLTVFNLLGQKVSTLVDGPMNAGQHTILFNASALSSGIYFYRIETDNFVQTKKMLLIK